MIFNTMILNVEFISNIVTVYNIVQPFTRKFENNE